jgi:hypothetical protein
LAVETLGAARLAKEIPAQRAVAAIVPRDEITAVLQDPEASAELFLRVTGGGQEESDQPSVIAMTWSRDELERLLERATGDSVVLTFDRDELSHAIGDVEAHGMRERVLVFAVAATGALGTGATIANAMPTGGGGGPVVTSIAPSVSAADAMVTDAASGAGYTAPAVEAGAAQSLTDASSAGGYTAPAAESTSAADAIVTDAASGAGYAAPAAQTGAVLSMTDASSAGGYTAPAVEAAGAQSLTDASSAGGYTAPAAEAGTSGAAAAASRMTDVSSAGGYGTVAATGSSGPFLDIQAPDTTDGLVAGGILLAIAGATFAARRGGTTRPA